jgi:HD-like signal output (HDOD) protein
MIPPVDKREAFKTIATDLARGELAFPTSARVAMKVRQALDDPECHIEAAVKLVQAEPLLSARVVAMANSASYNRSRQEITDVRTSVLRLGFGTVRLLASALVTRQLSGGEAGHANQKVAAQLWEHTAHVAALARVIAQRVTNVDPETAMFAGIVHEVGGFYLLSRAKDFPGLLDDDFEDWVEAGEADVGRAVLKVLDVPGPVLAAIQEYWDGQLKTPPCTLGDTLLLCDALAPVASPLREIGSRKRGGDLNARVDQAIGDETLIRILDESADEVGSLTAALSC